MPSLASPITIACRLRIERTDLLPMAVEPSMQFGHPARGSRLSRTRGACPGAARCSQELVPVCAETERVAGRPPTTLRLRRQIKLVAKRLRRGFDYLGHLKCPRIHCKMR